MEGIGPDNLRIAELMKRLASEEVREVVLATNPNVEGETTAAYLARLIKPLGIRVTRPASGLPVGGDLEFADEVTLGRALEGVARCRSVCGDSRVRAKKIGTSPSRKQEEGSAPLQKQNPFLYESIKPL